MTVERLHPEASVRDELGGLQRAMQSRAVIEQAKGILMFVYQVDADRAFSILRRYSQDGNLKLNDVAKNLIETSQLPGVDAGTDA